MTKELFEVDQSSVPSSGDHTTGYLDQIVGEGKKYATPELAAKAYLDSQAYIKRLESENATYRDNTSKIDSILEKISSGSVKAPVSQDPLPTTGNGEGAPDIAALVNSVLDQRSAKQVKEDNAKRALVALTEHYGDSTKAKLAIAKLTNTEETKELYYKMASTDPESFITLVKSRVQASSDSSDPSSSFGSQTPSGDSAYVPWSEAKKVLLTDKKKYYSKEYQALLTQSEAYYMSKKVDYYKQT